MQFLRIADNNLTNVDGPVYEDGESDGGDVSQNEQHYLRIVPRSFNAEK